jgi:hypothetical protein
LRYLGLLLLQDRSERFVARVDELLHLFLVAPGLIFAHSVFLERVYLLNGVRPVIAQRRACVLGLLARELHEL